MFVEQMKTGEMEMVIQKYIKDIPNGAYHEFFPNGNIRIKGTLDGYNADGTLKKTGEWKEWDANGNVIRQETYP
jgi:antitoxin component YwqK of YwqJK toxin-antitoxin module